MGSVGTTGSNSDGRRFVEEYIGRKLTTDQWNWVNGLINETKSLPDKVTETSERRGISDPTGNKYGGDEPSDRGFLPPDQYESELARIKALPGVTYTVETRKIRNAFTRESETWRKITYEYNNPEKDLKRLLDTLKSSSRR